MTTITVTPLATYRNDKPYPFCPGCGHAPVLDRLNDALVQLGIDHEDIVIVSDILIRLMPIIFLMSCDALPVVSWNRENFISTKSSWPLSPK